jgi:hypothetical protein
MPKSKRKPAAPSAGLEALMKLQAGKDIINRYTEKTKERFKQEFGDQHNPESFINDFITHSIATADAKKSLSAGFTANGITAFKKDLDNSLDLKFIIYKEILAQNLQVKSQLKVAEFINGTALNSEEDRQHLTENTLLTLIENQEEQLFRKYNRDRDPDDVTLPNNINIDRIVIETVAAEIVNPLLETMQSDMEAKLGENNPNATPEEIKKFKSEMREEIDKRITALTNNEDKTFSLESVVQKQISSTLSHLQQEKYSDQRSELEKFEAQQKNSDDVIAARVNANKKRDQPKPAEIQQPKTAPIEKKAAKPRTEISSSDLINLIKKGQVPTLESKKLMSSDELLESMSPKKSPKTPPPIIQIEMTEMTPRDKKEQPPSPAAEPTNVTKKKDTWATPVAGSTESSQSPPPLLSTRNTPPPASRTIVHPEVKKPEVELFTRKPLPKDPVSPPTPDAPPLTATAARVTPPPIPPKPVYTTPPATSTKTQEIKGVGISPASSPTATTKTRTINVSSATEKKEPEQAEEKNKVFVSRPEGFETLHRKVTTAPSTPSPTIAAAAPNTPAAPNIPQAPPISRASVTQSVSRTMTNKSPVKIKKKKHRHLSGELKVDTTRAPAAPAVAAEQPNSAPPASTPTETKIDAAVRRNQGLPPLTTPPPLPESARRTRGLPPLATQPPLPSHSVFTKDKQTKPDDKSTPSTPAAATTPDAKLSAASSVPDAPPLSATGNTTSASGTRQSSAELAAEVQAVSENLKKRSGDSETKMTDASPVTPASEARTPDAPPLSIVNPATPSDTRQSSAQMAAEIKTVSENLKKRDVNSAAKTTDTPPVLPVSEAVANAAPITPPAAPTEIENARANLKKADQPAPTKPPPAATELQDVKLQPPSPQKNTVVLPPIEPRTGNTNVSTSQARDEINFVSKLSALQTELNGLAQGRIKPDSIPRIEEIQKSSAAVIAQLVTLGNPGAQTVALMDEATRNLNSSNAIVTDTLQGYEKRLNAAKDIQGINQIVTELGAIANREQFQNIITRRNADFANAPAAEVKAARPELNNKAATAMLSDNSNAQALRRSLHQLLTEIKTTAQLPANDPKRIPALAAAKELFLTLQQSAITLLAAPGKAWGGVLNGIKRDMKSIQEEFARMESAAPVVPLASDVSHDSTPANPQPIRGSVTSAPVYPHPPQEDRSPVDIKSDLTQDSEPVNPLPVKGADSPEPVYPHPPQINKGPPPLDTQFGLRISALNTQLQILTPASVAEQVNGPTDLQKLFTEYETLKKYAAQNADSTRPYLPQLESARNNLSTLIQGTYDALDRLSQQSLQMSQALIVDSEKLKTTPDDAPKRESLATALDKLDMDVDGHIKLLDVLTEATKDAVKNPHHDGIQTTLDTIKLHQQTIENTLAALPPLITPVTSTNTVIPPPPPPGTHVMPTPNPVTPTTSPSAFDYKSILKKLPPEPTSRVNQCAGLTEASVIHLANTMANANDLSLLKKRMGYFSEKRDEARSPNEMNLGTREKLINDWNNKLFPFLEKINSRMNDLKDVINSLPLSESNLKSNLESSLKQFEQIRTDLYDEKNGIRQTIEDRLEVYGLHSIKIDAHEVRTLTRAPGESDHDFKQKIEQECQAMLGKQIIPSTSNYNMTGSGYKFNTVTETALVRIDGIDDPNLQLDEKARQTILSIKVGALPSQTQISVEHLRDDLILENTLFFACAQNGLSNHLADPSKAKQHDALATLIGSYTESPFTKNGLQTFLENKVKNHELSLPNFSISGPTCKSMAANIFNSYQNLIRSEKNKEVPHPKTLEIAMLAMTNWINSTRGQEKIPAHNKENYEVNRAVQLICEVMQRASKGDTWIFKYDSSLSARSEVFSGATIRDTQKLLAAMNKDFVKTLGQGMDMVEKTEQKRRIEDTVSKLATTDNALHDAPAPPSSPRPGGGGSP